MDEQNPVEPVPALPYETPGDAPANIVVLIRLGILVLAAVAVQYFLAGLNLLFTFLSVSRSGGGIGGVGFVFFCSALATTAGWMGLSWYLWKRAPQLALRMFGRNAMPSTSSVGGATGPTDFVAVGLIVLGLFEIIEAIYSAADVLCPMLLGRGMYGPSAFERGWLLFVPSIVRGGLGVWLVLGTRWIIDLIRKYSDRFGENPRKARG